VLPTTNAELVAIAGIGTATPVRVILIGAADTSLAALRKAREENAGEGERLRAAIAANQTFRAELMEKNVDVANIVAADVTGDGMLTLFAMI
jgi:hypothetical protein